MGVWTIGKRRKKKERIQASYTKWTAFLLQSNLMTKTSKLFTQEVIKLNQEIFVWTAGRLTVLMHPLDNSRLDLVYPCHHVPGCANCHCCCSGRTWSWNSKQLLHCSFLLLNKTISKSIMSLSVSLDIIAWNLKHWNCWCGEKWFSHLICQTSNPSSLL